MDYIVHGILQARILEWVAYPFSRWSFQPRGQTQVCCIAGGFFTSWATREVPLSLVSEVICPRLKERYAHTHACTFSLPHTLGSFGLREPCGWTWLNIPVLFNSLKVGKDHQSYLAQYMSLSGTSLQAVGLPRRLWEAWSSHTDAPNALIFFSFPQIPED